jgi:hypothetical protein
MALSAELPLPLGWYYDHCYGGWLYIAPMER